MLLSFAISTTPGGSNRYEHALLSRPSELSLSERSWLGPACPSHRCMFSLGVVRPGLAVMSPFLVIMKCQEFGEAKTLLESYQASVLARALHEGMDVPLFDDVTTLQEVRKRAMRLSRLEMEAHSRFFESQRVMLIKRRTARAEFLAEAAAAGVTPPEEEIAAIQMEWDKPSET